MKFTASTYGAYGLTIRSEIPLPGVTLPSQDAVDVQIRLGTVDRPLSEGGHSLKLGRLPCQAILSWEGIGSFQVRDGHEITVEPAAQACESMLRLPLLAVVLAMLLHQRGRLVLHASAVELNGSAIAFLGHPGTGKSSMAAAFHMAGRRLISDDMVALEPRPERPVVYPGFPQVKLWSDTLALLGESATEWSLSIIPSEKRAIFLTKAFAVSPLPLAALLVLEYGPSVSIELLGPQDSITSLIRHSYVPRVLPAAMRGAAAAAHLRQCADLARRVPVCLLRRPCDLELLPWVAEAVEEELSCVQGRAGLKSRRNALGQAARLSDVTRPIA